MCNTLRNAHYSTDYRDIKDDNQQTDKKFTYS